MLWADEIAEKIVKSGQYKPYWVDDMKTPSGKIHVGALRGVVIHDLIFKALKDLKVNVKYTYIFDDHDPMDALPVYLKKEQYEKYLGVPLYKVPSPVKGFESYAKYYAQDFIDVFNKIGCHPQVLWATNLYLDGKMNPLIKEVLDKAEKIRKIYEKLYKKEIPKDWYPFQPYCPKCGKVSTTKVYNWNGEKVSFICEVDRLKWTKGCGFKGKISPFSDKSGVSGKLSWKVEWPAKWKALGVTVEGAGKDHMSSGGSHDLAKLICEEIINYPVPYPLPYEFFLLGGKKMSSSKGIGSSASDMLDILPPELLRFLMVKTRINQAINFDPMGNTIPNLFDEYQKAAESYFSKKEDDNARIFELSQLENVEKPPIVRFSILSQWVQMPNLGELIEKENLSQWAKYAKVWVEKYAPESEKFLIQEKLPKEAHKLTENQKKFLGKISSKIDKKWEAEEFQKELYEWAKELNVSSKDAFSAIYLSLIGKDHGPKAGWLILSLDKGFIKKRFSEVV